MPVSIRAETERGDLGNRIAAIPENHALAIAIMSYNGRVDFGLLGDYDAMPDLDSVAQMIEQSLSEPLDAARSAVNVETEIESRR